MKTAGKWISGSAVVSLAALLCMTVGLALALGLTSARSARADESTFKWVIITTASAKAIDGSLITFTGTGTFIPGESEDVTGGGTWQTLAPDGVTVTGSGNFIVIRFVRFDLAPGAVANPSIHAGLSVLQVDYLDGSRGVLIQSCHLPGTPASVTEGVTATKGFTNFWNTSHGPGFFQVVSEAD